jgi:hypothetical protein
LFWEREREEGRSRMAAEDRNGEVSTQAECTGCSPRESSFDELAKELASGSISRGKALRLMGAALVGGTLASLGIREASADDECKPEGKKCRKDKQCCSGTCTEGHCAAACTSNGGTCSTSTDCCSGNCSNGFCCPSGYVGLSNGTCAKPCTTEAECPAGCGCVANSGPPSGNYCGGAGGSFAECGHDRDCTIPGEFCAARALPGIGGCVRAC